MQTIYKTIGKPQEDDSRPENLTLAVKFCVESDVQVENAQTLHLDLRRPDKRTHQNLFFDSFLYYFLTIMILSLKSIFRPPIASHSHLGGLT